MSQYIDDWIANLAGDGAAWKPVPMSPLVSSWITPGKIRIDGESLAWSDSWGGRQVMPDDAAQALPRFLELADAQGKQLAEGVLAYAQRWGVLGLCTHGLPWSHELRIQENDLGRLSCGSGCWFPMRDGWCVESISTWQNYARQARAIIALSAELRKLKPLNAYNARRAASIWEHWKVALSEFPRLIEQMTRGTDNKVWHARMALSWPVNRWLLGLAQLRSMFWWTDNGPSLKLQSAAWPGEVGAYLFPALATQLALIVNGSLDLAVCFACSRPFYLRKGQRLLMNTYCKECGLREARRDAVKRYRERNRRDPKRQRMRKRLTHRQREAIGNAPARPGLVRDLAEKYGVGQATVYGIRNSENRRAKQGKRSKPG